MLNNTVDIQYIDHLERLLNNGIIKDDRTGTGTSSIFGHHMRFDLTESFPLLEAKFTAIRPIIHELIWFLRGETNIGYLQANNVKIWNEWANPKGDLGPVYGKQWRSWETPNIGSIDQLQVLLDGLNSKPDSRRHIISAWNPGELPDETISPQANASAGLMALAPCHTMFQFYTHLMNERQRFQWVAINMPHLREYRVPIEQFDKLGVPKRYLSCHLYQRSADWFLGAPFNIASYALLTHIIAKSVNMVPYEFIHSFGDTHLYTNHFEQAKELLFNWENDERELTSDRPQIVIDSIPKNPWEYESDDFEVTNYSPLPAIKAPIAV
jgi:thymidylate synthase